MAVPIRGRLLADSLSPVVGTILETHPRASLYFGVGDDELIATAIRHYKKGMNTNEHIKTLWQEFNATNYPEKRRMAIAWYEMWLKGELDVYRDERDEILESIHELTGKDLACWCPLDGPCHADILLRLANDDGQANAQAPQQVLD